MAGQEFVFVGEALAFDFVNTEIAERRKAIDLLRGPDDFSAWWGAAAERYALPVTAGQAARPSFERAKALRGALRRIFSAVVAEKSPDDADMDTLNAVLAAGHTRLELMPGNRFGMQQVTDADQALLLPIAHSAAWLLTECEPERLHKCKNDWCVLMFLDTTKNGNRVWCSIDCMNRARSRENYARKQHSEN
ncbi:MAG: ABATE domain-containing protein [Pleurocapsa minor GSE-CHR-MK-17-07R]|jgi:predicted RNA-binding Zn ribbon-like protein|nr:ABATE domain-containing protein [Pleurocapsa minor GSE-CHR-MK 17-07R]